MNEVIMLHSVKPGEILQTVLENRIPVIMSYLSPGGWNLARVMLTDVGTESFDVKVSPQKKSQPIEIQTHQSVGMSFQYGYGSGYDKFVFDAAVVAVESPTNPGYSGAIVLAMPQQIELVQRRGYLRVNTPESLQVNVELWHRSSAGDEGETTVAEAYQSWQGRLVDVSAGGLQVAIDLAQGPEVKKGQCVGLRFAPLPHETPLALNAYVRSISPTADNKSICIGLEMVGLEASPEGRLILQRLCNIVDQYHQINQSSGSRQDGPEA